MKKAVFLLSLVACGAVLTQSHVEAQDLISSIVKGGITADGDVAGAATDFLINLNVPFDNSPGLSLAAGNTFRIILPPEFVDEGTLATVTAFSSRTCTPGDLQCNTSAFIQGWPQRPIVNTLPPVTPSSENETGNPVYTLSSEQATDGSHIFTHTAIVDVGPGSPPPGPGIKQIHMILPGFRNPTTPGDYEIQVVAETGPGGEVQTGAANLRIRPEIGPSVNLTTVYDPMRRNTVYQEIEPGGEVLPYDFWLWNENGGPLLDAEIVGEELVQGGETVGLISITAPAGASGQSLVSTGPSTLATEVFFGQETARLNAQFSVGDLPGEYAVRIDMVDGNFQQMTVNVIPEPATVVLAVALFALGLFSRRSH